MKKFNTTAVCVPSKHYMVDLSDKIEGIEKLIDDGKYFTINRARQYGKTTTLEALIRKIEKKYLVISLDFQEISDSVFETEGSFVQGMARIICDARDFMETRIPDEYYGAFKNLDSQDSKMVKMDELFRIFSRWCNSSEEAIILIIDEVDSATNNQVFLDFLAGLRALYIKHQKNAAFKTFQSVILAGVTDVKHLKSKIREEDQHKVNSPWNIAADFDIDMSLSEDGIKGMLDEYEADHNTGMDTDAIAHLIRDYTNGYPYLVSRICEIIDNNLIPDKFDSLSEAWTDRGIDEAIKKILSEENTLFESLIGKLENYPNLKSSLRRVLLRGEVIAHQPDDDEQKQLRMYGFIVNNHNTVAVANKIFEMRLYNYFIGESNKNNDLRQIAAANKSVFVDDDGLLDIRKIMEHFIIEHNRIHGEQTAKFLEEEGRERFITYIAPIINGTGTYDIEPQTRNHKRMDLVIHYLGRRYIIELKIWRGERYNSDGEKQISEYLDYWNLDTGYMLSFNFNKKKKSGVERISIGNKVLFEGTV